MARTDGGFGLGIYSLFVVGAISLVVFTIVALLGMALIGGVVEGMGATDDPVNKTASPNPEVNNAVAFDSTEGRRSVLEVFSVVDSTGFAVELFGAADSYVQSQGSVTLAADETWTVATWASVDSGAASETRAAVSANGRVIIEYNGTADEWRAWYYDEGGRDSYVASVAAPDQPGNLSLVTATSNGTHFWIYANTTKGDVVDITGDNVADVTLGADNWDGRLDETRTFDDATNDSEQASLFNSPVGPQPERNRTARLTYDEGEGDTTNIYFTTTRADLSNFSWVDGLAGNDLVEGTDYELDTGDGTITALGGGLIDGAPVVWIDYRYQPLNRIGHLAELLKTPWELFASAPLVIVAVVVIATLMAGVVGAIRWLPDTNTTEWHKGR